MKRILLVLTCLAAGATAVFSQSVEIDEDEVKIQDTLSVTSDEVKVLGELLVDPDGDGPKQALLKISEEGGIEIFYVGKYRSLEETVIGMVNPETIDVQSVVVDGGINTSIEPGIYNNVTFTGDGSMEVGKYIVYGDFTINQGVTVTVDTISQDDVVYDFFGEPGGISGLFSQGGDNYGGAGMLGGGNGRRGDFYSGSYQVQISGGGAGGPCGSSPQYDGSFARGGGWVLIDVYGIFNNLGQIVADGSDGSNDGMDGGTADGAGGGGYLGIRTHTVSNIGTISCNGGNGGNDSLDGGGGGGGVIEIYYYASNADDAVNGGPFSAEVGSRGLTSGSDGTVRLINSVMFDELFNTGARSINEIDDYEELLDPNVGAILEALGGWEIAQ